MLIVVTAVKLVAEVALLALLGRGVLAWLAGAGRQRSPCYRILRTISEPALRVARWLSPRAVLDRHLPLVAFLMLSFLWLGATVLKIRFCLEIGVTACR